MNNEFISNLLFSNVEDSGEKENFLKAIAYVDKQSAKGEEIDNDEIDKILGISNLSAVEKLGKISDLITVALNIGDEYSMIKETLETENVKIPEGISDHIMFCCKEQNRKRMLENDDLFVESYLKFDQVSKDNISAEANKKTLVLLLFSSLIGCIYETSKNDNEAITNVYSNYMHNRSRSDITCMLYLLLLNYTNRYNIKSVTDLKNDVLGDLVNFEISMIFPRLKKCNFESIEEMIDNFCHSRDTEDENDSNIDENIKQRTKEIMDDDIMQGNHRLEDIYESYLDKDIPTANIFISYVIDIIVEDVMDNSSKANFGSVIYRKDMIIYITNRYYDYSERSNMILIIYTTIMDFLVNNRNPYTYDIFKESLITLLKKKFIKA